MSKLLIPAMIILCGLFPQKKTNVIFFGDSITEQGVKPGGYLTRIDSMCTAEKKKEQYQFTGAGVSGNKIYDLYLRLEDDVLKKDPDVVIIFIGVNDVWHKLMGTGTDADKFKKFYQAIINKIKEKGSKIILCTPAAIGEKTDFSNQLDGDLNNYSNIIRELAKQNNLPLVDLRKVFLDYNMAHNKENKESGILTVDKVHLNEKGNQLVAEQMWKAIKAL
jgi:lysophospholipase L1-like esterase